MAFSTTAKNTMLDALTVDRIRLHSGDPGVSGTDNALGSGLSTAVFNAAAGGARTLNANVTVTGLSASQAVSYVSFWQNAGTVFHGSKQLSGSAQADSSGNYTLLAFSTSVSITDPV